MNLHDKPLGSQGKIETQDVEIRIGRRLLLIVCAYLLFLSLSEYLSTRLDTVQIGLIGHGLGLLSLLALAALSKDEAEQKIFLTLAFAPLIRLISLTLPLTNLPRTYWYLLVGTPIFISIFLVIRYGGFTIKQIGLTGRYWFLQILIGVTGIGLGYLEYLILRPEPLAAEMTFAQLWLPALILIVFTGLLEEVVFRGLMQSAFTQTFGPWVAIFLISILFAVLHLGYQSFWDVIFVFDVALFFGIITELTGSIWGISMAHGLTNVALFLIFPFILG